MPPPVARQVTWETTLDTCSPSSFSIGWGSLRDCVVAVHPGVADVCTEAIALPLGSSTLTVTVLALSDSLGTRKATTADSAPPGTLSGTTSTWAWATPVRAAPVRRPPPSTSPIRRAGRRAGGGGEGGGGGGGGK